MRQTIDLSRSAARSNSTTTCASLIKTALPPGAASRLTSVAGAADAAGAAPPEAAPASDGAGAVAATVAPGAAAAAPGGGPPAESPTAARAGGGAPRVRAFAPASCAACELLEPHVASSVPTRAHVVADAAAGAACGCGRLHLARGVEYDYCACGLSKTQPLCDGAACEGTIFAGKAFTLPREAPANVLLCQCKRTACPPFCDGAHSKLTWDDLKW